MPTGIAEATAVLGIIGFSIKLFELSIQGLVLLGKARNFHGDVAAVKLLIELETHKLHAWASEAGLMQNPSTLLVMASDAPMVPRILGYMKELVSNLDNLRKVYGIRVERTSDQVTILEDGESAFERLRIDRDSECSNTIKKIFRQRKKPWLRLKWVVVDQDKIQRLLLQVQQFILELQKILDRAQQARIHKSLDILLRNAVMNSADQQELSMLGSGGQVFSHEQGIAAAARLKQHCLSLGLLESPEQGDAATQPVSSNYQASDTAYQDKELFEDTHLSSDDLTIVAYSHNETRFLARLNRKAVMIEFKNYVVPGQELTRDRIRKVAAFLQELDPTFHGLACLGYTEVCGRYAHVFDLSDYMTLLKGSQTKLPSYRTLRQLVLGLATPSLNLRISMAITLLETMLQLHTAGWLHKEFRPDNVIFLRSSSRHLPDFLHADMRVTGYSYARADKQHEMTEPLHSELEADLYRHPTCLQRPRVTYQRAFDIFSVGCILLEIGLWCTLSSLCEGGPTEVENGVTQHLDLLKSRQKLLLSPQPITGHRETEIVRRPSHDREIFQRLEACTGRAYVEIVEQMINVPTVQKLDSTAVRSAQSTTEHDLVGLEIENLANLRALCDVL